MMKWNHLPEGGGLNNQDPRLLEFFDVIYAEECKAEEERQRKQKAEMERNNKSRGGSGRRVAGRRR